MDAGYRAVAVLQSIADQILQKLNELRSISEHRGQRIGRYLGTAFLDHLQKVGPCFVEHTIHNRVVVMRDGSEVFDRLQLCAETGTLPSVILLDIKMPKVSGIEVLRRIKGDTHLKGLPVVMLTSSRQSPDVAECYTLGANAYVVKPVESDAFFEAVKTAGRFWAIMNERPATSIAEIVSTDVARA